MTPGRENRIFDVLMRRQFDLTVLLENVHDPHNISAVLRTCDAVGIQEIFVLNRVPKPKKFGRRTSSGSVRWVDVHYFQDLEKCISAVRSKYKNIFAMSSAGGGKNIYNADLSDSAALAFGNERDGLSSELLQIADAAFEIPMAGMVESLNISVACAVALFEAKRQRDVKRMYDGNKFGAAQIEIYKRWVLRELRRVRRK